MAAPRMQPSGFFEVVSSARMDGKLELFGFGQHEKAINPGDLVIVTTNYLQDGFKVQQIQASLKLRGNKPQFEQFRAVKPLDFLPIGSNNFSTANALKRC